MLEFLGLLHSQPAVIRGTLEHKYLKRNLLDLVEGTVAALFEEQPNIPGEMTEMLEQIEDGFADGYDPGVFILELPVFQSLDGGLRDRLLATVGREYRERFNPEKRLKELRVLAASFSEALHAWHRQVTADGVNAKSAPLWEALRETAITLREFLEDRELTTRWIP